MPEQHSVLGPSSASRWINCPGSLCLGKQFEDKTSVYAEEGTLAHAIAELRARKRYTTEIKPSEYEEKLAELQAGPLYNPEMMECTTEYLNLIDTILPEHINPVVVLEQRLDYTDFAQGGFGTGDCIVYSSDRVDVVDYKHGKGVKVEISENPQLKLYGLAAVTTYLRNPKGIVGTHICQPRNGGNSSCLYTAPDLVKWGTEVVKPAAAKAHLCFSTDPAFLSNDMLCAGAHCRFCKAKAVCRVRGTAVAVEAFGRKEAHTYDDDELREILTRAKAYVGWVSDIEAHCLQRAMSGNPVPGFKAVHGRGSRVFKNPDSAFAALQMLGFDPEKFYVKKPLSVAQTEKIVGTKVFRSLGDSLFETNQGKPTLVPESDTREAITGAEVFFA